MVYAAVLGTICAALITGAGAFTADRRTANAKAEEVRSILDVLGVPLEEKATSRELVELFDSHVQIEGATGDRVVLYKYVDPGNGTVIATAVPFRGMGLQGPIAGVLALEPDMKTIHGITFHEQEETPGLGGEIASTWFREQFKGKIIESSTGEVGIRIVRGGGASGPHEVDAITGATMTSRKVEGMLNEVLGRLPRE